MQIDHVLSKKISFNKSKIEIISSIFSNHKDLRLEIPHNWKFTHIWRLNNMLLKNKLITEETREEIKRYLQTKVNANIIYQNLYDTTRVLLRGKYIELHTFLPQETRKVSSKQYNILPQITRKRRTNKIQRLVEDRK